MARSLAERLRAHEQQKARLAEQEAKLKDDERKARTRRLIQAGGLIEKAGLLIERVGAKSGRQNITGRLGRGRRTTRRRGDRCPRAAGAPSEAQGTCEQALAVILIGMINLWNRLAISLRYEHPVSTAA